LIVLAGVVVYANSFAGVFVFDDNEAIINNPTIRQWWRLDQVLNPPSRDLLPMEGRPLLNLTLAINYAISGTQTWSYHLVNLMLHLANGLLLFDLLRRTYQRPAVPSSLGNRALPLAAVIAALWIVHPLQTEVVTYVVERAESLVALFYLLTFYCVLRSVDSDRGVWWKAGAVMACLLGMASKEIMVTAPVMLFVYDRTFLAGSFAEAWRRRWRLYLLLASTWLLLVVLILSTGQIFCGSEFGVKPRWGYMLTQPKVILHYLRLALWPHPLCAYYAWPVSESWREIWPALVVVLAGGMGSLWALVKRPQWGFLGLWFFGILAPTSSVVPLRDIIVERRMYLPLVAVVTLLVVGGNLAGLAMIRRGWLSGRVAVKVGASAAIIVGVTWGVLTVHRNLVYYSVWAIWEDTAIKAPSNVRAHSNLGNMLVAKRDFEGALMHYRTALRLQPHVARNHYDVGNTLAYLGRVEEAQVCYEKAIEIDPRFADPYNNLASLFARRGKLEQAKIHYQHAIQVKPDYAEAHNNLANILAQQGDTEQAIIHYRKALAGKPDYAEAHNNLGFALANTGQIDEAVEHYEKALKVNSNYAVAHYNLANALYRQGRLSAALPHWQDAVRLQPNHGGMVNQLAWILATSSVRDGSTAIRLAEHAVRLTGGQDPRALRTLAAAYAAIGQFVEAQQTASSALRLASNIADPGLAESLRSDIQAYLAGMPLREAAMR
jgi:tetratricopeptide (TPR) repeat protein